MKSRVSLWRGFDSVQASRLDTQPALLEGCGFQSVCVCRLHWDLLGWVFLCKSLCPASSVPQPWPSVSNLAKDFIQRLLPLDPATRLTADQAIHHPWVVTMAASSSMRNLHRSISQNLRQRASRSSSRCPSSTASSGDSNSVGPGRRTSLERNQEQQQGRASGLTQPQRAIQHPARRLQEHHRHPAKAPDSWEG